MKRRVAVIVAVVAVLAASVTTAVAAMVTADDGNRFGHRDGMMSSQCDDRTTGTATGAAWPAGTRRMMSGPSCTGCGWRSEYAYLAEMVAHHEEAVAAARQLERSAARRDARVRCGHRRLPVRPDRPDAGVARRLVPRAVRAGGLPADDAGPDRPSGDRLDRVFLQDMVGHHMGAVMMSQRLLMRGVADHEQVEVLAQTIRDDQHAEIFQMQRWLREWFGRGWRHGMHAGITKVSVATG